MMSQNPHAYLMLTNVTPKEWLAKVLGYPQLIGRHFDCEISIPEKYRQVSRKHAQIEYRSNNFWIRDIGSSGGTLLNGVPLVPNRETQIVIGDRISLSTLELYLISADASFLQRAGCGSEDDEALNNTASSAALKPVESVPDERLRRLSPAELEVVRWICRGLMTDKEIGQQLFRSPHTVRTQLCSVFQKLDVHSREQLIGLLKQREIAWTRSGDLDLDMQKTDDSMCVKDIKID